MGNLVAILTDAEARRDVWGLGYDALPAKQTGKIYILDVSRKDAPAMVSILKDAGYAASYI